VKVLLYTVIIVLFDQITKLLVKGFSIPALGINHEGMYHGQRISIIDDFFRLTFIENPGMAFGIDPGLNMKLWMSLFSLIASIGLIIYLYHIRNEKFAARLSISFILGGAIGNLLDRMFYGVLFNYAPLFYGKVVDFLDFDFFDITIFGRNYDRFPVFNIADSAVTVGVILLLVFYNKLHAKEESVPEKETGTPLITEADPAENNITNIDNASPENENISNRNRDGDTADNGQEIPL
jgi:signal peptidase II